MNPSRTLLRARSLYAGKDWAGAFRLLRSADSETPLAAEDQQRLATCAYLLGDQGAFMVALERAHQLHIDAKEAERAIRCAFWMGLTLALNGEMSKASGWLGRASRLLEQRAGECVEHGYLLLPRIQRSLDAGDTAAALRDAGRAAAIGGKFAEPDLVALACHLEGRIEITSGNVERGLALLDEAMLSVINNELSPIATGIIYCNVIEGCQEVYALERSCDWTEALVNWCASQPTMVAFTGKCRVHRIEIMCQQGRWPDAAREATAAHTRLDGRGDLSAEAAAAYQQAELHRLLGEERQADRAYARASRLGKEPQPGLALLRLAQDEIAKAVTGVERVLSAPSPRLDMAKTLEACVEIMLAAGRCDAAELAARHLRTISERYATRALVAMSAACEGLLRLEHGDPEAAVPLLRTALDGWQAARMPYAVARTRLSLGRAYRELGDDDGCELEWTAARSELVKLGAKPDLDRLRRLQGTAAARPAGLTDRELEVLRLVAKGKTNKETAQLLHLSPRTVDRHLSNIYAKIGSSTRAAAAAFAFRRGVI